MAEYKERYISHEKETVKSKSHKFLSLLIIVNYFVNNISRRRKTFLF